MNPEEIPQWVPFLKRTLLFRDLSAEELERVAVRLQPLSLPKGSTLYSRGDAGDAFYLVTSGRVRLLADRSGREAVTAFLGRGDALGELSLLTGEPRSVTVRLDTTSEFLMLSKQDFEDVARQNPSILIHLSRIIAQRMLRSQRVTDPAASGRQQVLVLASALDGPLWPLFAVHLGVGLMEETRKRVLWLDMGPQCGAVAKALGMKPVLTSEAMLRESDLRNPEVLVHLTAEHPSGLRVMSLPPSVLGGRLYRGIFLLVNLLRDLHDFVLISIGGGPGDVEKSILEEADQWVLLGHPAGLHAFHKLEEELGRGSVGSKKRLSVWLGSGAQAQEDALPAEGLSVVPWPDELTVRYARGASPFQVLEGFPRSRRALRRLVRRLGGMSVGLAMGSGAALGYSLIGVLKGFKRAHIDVDLVAGTSIGALFGGFYAMGMEPEEIEVLAARVDKAWIYENLFWDLTVPRSGIFAGTTLLRFIRSYFGEREFRQMDLPFACVATDIETGEEVILRDGKVAEAIRASCGIPLIFSPFHHAGRYLVDGGLVDPVPVRAVSQLGADILLSVNLTLPASERKGPVRRRHQARMQSLVELATLGSIKELALPPALRAPNMLEVLFQMIYTMEHQIARSRQDLVHVCVQPELSTFSWTELHRAREIIDAGERAAEQAIPKIKALLPYFSDTCKVPPGSASRQND